MIKKKERLKPIIFLRIAWMSDYQGVTELDIPKGAGKYIQQNKDGGEVFNFSKNKGNYFGYVRIPKGRNLDLTRLGVPRGKTSIDGVTVVFFATNPVYGNQYIVGWYKNAILYNNLQANPIVKAGEWGNYIAKCKIREGILLKTENRLKEIEGPGQANLWYPADYLNEKQLSDIRDYLDNPVIAPKPKGGKGRGWQIDAELRKKIEVAAIDAVADYFEIRGFSINDVHKQNKGWDIEVSKGNKTFHLEVKGTQSEFNTIELTPNEFKQLLKNSSTYRLCVVSYTLDNNKQKVDIFYCEKRRWLNEKRESLSIEKVTSARVYLN